MLIILPSHKANMWRGAIQSFIYKKCLVCIPHTKQNVWVEMLNLFHLLMEPGVFSCLTRIFVGSVNSGWQLFSKKNNYCETNE